MSSATSFLGTMSEFALSGLIASAADVDVFDAPDAADGPDVAGPCWPPPKNEHPVRTMAVHTATAVFRYADSVVTAIPFTAGSMLRSGR